MNFVDRFLKKIKRGIFKWIKMPKKNKISVEDKKVLKRFHEEYTDEAILRHFGIKTPKTALAIVEEGITEIFRDCRKRKEENEYAHTHPEYEKCRYDNKECIYQAVGNSKRRET